MNRNLSRFLPLVLLAISSAYAVRVGEPDANAKTGHPVSTFTTWRRGCSVEYWD